MSLDCIFTIYGRRLVGKENLASTTKTTIVTLESVPILNTFGTVTSGIVAGHKLYQAFTDPEHHWFDGVEGGGTVIVAIFFPEAVLAYGAVITVIDWFR